MQCGHYFQFDHRVRIIVVSNQQNQNANRRGSRQRFRVTTTTVVNRPRQQQRIVTSMVADHFMSLMYESVCYGCNATPCLHCSGSTSSTKFRFWFRAGSHVQISLFAWRLTNQSVFLLAHGTTTLLRMLCIHLLDSNTTSHCVVRITCGTRRLYLGKFQSPLEWNGMSVNQLDLVPSVHAGFDLSSSLFRRSSIKSSEAKILIKWCRLTRSRTFRLVMIHLIWEEWWACRWHMLADVAAIPQRNLPTQLQIHLLCR